MRTNAGKSLRFHFAFWFFVLALTPILIIGILNHLLIKQEFRKNVYQQDSIVAQLTAANLSRLFHAQEQLINLARNDLDSGLILPRRFQKYLTRLAKYARTFEHLCILSPGGRVKNISPYKKAYLGFDFSNYPFVKAVIRSRGTKWSNTFLSPFSEKNAIAFAGWSRQGVIVGIIVLEELSRKLVENQNLEIGKVFVTDTRGVVVASHDKNLVTRRVNMSRVPVVRAGLDNRFGTYAYEMDGEKYIGSVCKIPEVGWLAIVTQPESVALSPLNNYQVFFAGLCGAVLLVVLIVSFVAPNSFLRLINGLGSQISEIASGNYELAQAAETLKIKEFDELVNNVRNMAKAIQMRERYIENAKKDWEKTFDAVPELIFLIDRESKIIRANKAVAKLFNRTPAELVGKKCYQLVHGTDSNPPFCPHVRSLNSGKVENEEVELDNGTFLFVSCSPVVDESGRHVGTVHVARDITEKKKMEKEITESKNLLENVFENSVDAIGVVDRRGRFIKINKRTEVIFGYSRHELIGKKFTILYADNSELDELVEALRRSGIVREREMRMRLKNGEVVPMELSIGMVYDADGSLMGSVAVARDLREKKSLEAQLLQAQKMEAIGILAGGVAHDFNNLLTTIKGYTQLLLLDEEVTNKEGDALKQIEHAASRAAELVKHLLTFSRKVESSATVVNLNTVIQNVEKLLKRTLPKTIDVRMELDSNLKVVEADPVQIEQIILNLAINARDAMRGQGKLTVETKNVNLSEVEARRFVDVDPGDYVLLAVSDTGSGIQMDILDKIFDPFFTTKEVGKGTGLGLSIVYGIVKSHRGVIDVETGEGEGTCFKIYFPVAASKGLGTRGTEKVIARGGEERILLVDDDESVAEVSAQVLSRFGYRVTWLQSAEEALKMFQDGNGDVDLVILDFMMPRMDGLTCMKKLKSIDDNVKILFATGYASETPPEKFKEEGAIEVINKPFDMDELLIKVRAVLDK